jgi:cyclophilin family peptidyl-prolyl cis-trans isomerase
MNGRLLVVACLLVLSLAGCNRADKTEPASAAGESESGGLRPALAIGGALRTGSDPAVVLRTSLGTIKLRLNAAKAPLTVDNFLAQVESGFYDQTIFHQVEPGYCIVGGGFRANLAEKIGRYGITNEATNGLSNRRGTVAMARPADAIESSTGQFFINVGDNPDFDHRGDSADHFGYCVFGEVVEGMDVVDRIAQAPARNVEDFPRLPVETVLLESATKAR